MCVFFFYIRLASLIPTFILLHPSIHPLPHFIHLCAHTQDNPQVDKYKRVRLNNAKFHRHVGRHPAAMELLDALGFVRIQGEEEVLELKRNDPGLLWLGRSSIEEAAKQNTAI